VSASCKDVANVKEYWNKAKISVTQQQHSVKKMQVWTRKRCKWDTDAQTTKLKAFIYYTCCTNGTQMQTGKKKKKKRTNKHKEYKCTVNESHNVVHKQLTIVCTSEFKNQPGNKTKPSLINIHTNSKSTTFS